MPEEQPIFNNQILDTSLIQPLSNSLDAFQKDYTEFSPNQMMHLAGETLIDVWENQGDAKQALVYAGASIFNSNFISNAEIAFGESFDVQKAQALGDDILTGKSGVFPDVEFLSNAEMKGALGAYAESTKTIYINSDFVINNKDNPSAIGKVLVEEKGHFIDAYASPVDSAGDEGEILARLVAGESFTKNELQSLKLEDDSTTLIIDGQELTVEQSNRNRQEILLGNKVDFDGDGKTDFIRQEKGHFANDRYRMFETYLSNGNGSFRNAWVSEDASRGFHGDMTNLVMGDFNGDGKTDFLRQEKGGYASDQWWMFETFISNGDGSFTSRSAMHDTAMHGDLTNIFVGDFNGDGKSDFIRQEKGHFANDAGRMLETYLSNGDGSFTKAWVSEDASRGFHGDMTNLFMGDFNGDGKTDFLRQEKGAFASDKWWMFETFISNGDGSFTSRSAMHDTAMHGDLTNIFVGDFNGDGKSDFLRQEKGHFANDAGRMLETYLSNGDGSFNRAWVSEDAVRGFHGDMTNLFTGDFNGDGKTDFLRQKKGAYASDQWWMFETFISNGDGSFNTQFVMHDHSKNGDLTNLFVGDFDGNGSDDFLLQEKGHFANDIYGMLQSYTSYGNGSFTKRWQADEYAMHGDLTNLFTSNTKRPPIVVPQPETPGYYPDLSSLTDADWKYQSRDNLFFDGNTQNGESLASVKQVYSDLSKGIFGSYKRMTAGYFDTTNYRGTHYGIDMAGLAGNQVRTVIGGITTLVQSTPGNYFVGVKGDDGNLWIYGHLENYSVKIGSRIEAGNLIGTIFDGAYHKKVWMAQHLHLEVHKGHTYKRANSMSPLQAFWQLMT